MKITELKYNEIKLRPLEPEDIELLFEWENNMEVWELSNTQAPFSRFILKQYIENSFRDIYESKQLRLIIEDLTGDAVGAIDLFDFEPYHQRAGVGILIHDKDQRQKGYASDALLLLCKYAVANLGLHQLYANIAEDNQASIRLFEKNGFVQCGIKKNWLRSVKGWRDELMFQKIMS